MRSRPLIFKHTLATHVTAKLTATSGGRPPYDMEFLLDPQLLDGQMDHGNAVGKASIADT